MSVRSHAECDKSPADPAICSDTHENAQSGDKARARVAICHFEQVQARGDSEILRLAHLQHGHVHRLQLLAAGCGRGALAHRLRTGWLREAFPSVYRVGGAGDDRLGRMMAAALHFRGGAIISGLDAASLWGMLDSTQQPADRSPISVLLVGRNARPRPGITIHRIGSVSRSDVRRRRGIPLTSPARTLLDLAGELDALELEAAALIALRQLGLRGAQLAEVIDRNPHAKGVATLRSLLERPRSLRDTRSGYERKLRRLLREAELPLPLTNVMVAGKLVDAFWPELNLVIEFDGWEEHGRRPQFESDRLTDQRLTIAGHHVMRVTARQIDHTPVALVARIASMITTLRLGRHSAPSPSAAQLRS